MEELSALMHGFAVVLTPTNIALMFIGVSTTAKPCISAPSSSMIETSSAAQ